MRDEFKSQYWKQKKKKWAIHLQPGVAVHPTLSCPAFPGKKLHGQDCSHLAEVTSAQCLGGVLPHEYLLAEDDGRRKQLLQAWAWPVGSFSRSVLSSGGPRSQAIIMRSIKSLLSHWPGSPHFGVRLLEVLTVE
jgi:hypothetical protein